jgi:hypothetical protein
MWGYILKRVRILAYLIAFTAIYEYTPIGHGWAFAFLFFFIWSDLVELIDDVDSIKKALKTKETEIWNSLLTRRKHF